MQSSLDNDQKRDEFMSNFSPLLVHRIMLTDPAEFSNLTMSGLPRTKTLSFQEFAVDQGLLENHDANDTAISSENMNNSQSISAASQVSKMMRRAYHDMTLSNMQTTKSYKPLSHILLEIHSFLRSLIPTRTDLHSRLVSDETILDDGSNDTLGHFLKYLMEAADCLIMLESEDRSSATVQWRSTIAAGVLTKVENLGSMEEEMGQVEIVLDRPKKGEEHLSSEEEGIHTVSMSLHKFALASTIYIHAKAEMCQTDVADFQLGHILAPRIHVLGKEYLKRHFRKHSGASIQGEKGKDSSRLVVPNTKIWVQEMVKESNFSREDLISSGQKRGEMMISTGWVDNILFRSPRHVDEEETDSSDTTISPSSPKNTPFLMPEVLYMDIDAVRQIRMTAKLSVVGSALGLHACTAAGVGDSALRSIPLDREVEECRQKMVNTMANRSVGSREMYEQNVADAVLELAKVLNPSISPTTKDIIQSRSMAVLRGEDPVLKLLDNRMRGIFRDMMTWSPQQQTQQIPIQLKTGRILSLSKDNSASGVKQTTYSNLFKSAAKNAFASQGFAFYAEELADANLIANRVINMVLTLHGDSLLESLVLEECRETED